MIKSAKFSEIDGRIATKDRKTALLIATILPYGRQNFESKNYVLKLSEQLEYKSNKSKVFFFR